MKFKIITALVGLAFFLAGCDFALWQDDPEPSGQCYVYTAAYVADPETATATVAGLLDKFPEPSGRVTDVLAFIQGEREYQLFNTTDVDPVADWIALSARCWVEFGAGERAHAMPVISVEKTEAYTYYIRVVSSDAARLYAPMAFTLVDNNGLWIDSGEYAGLQVRGFYGFRRLE